MFKVGDKVRVKKYGCKEVINNKIGIIKNINYPNCITVKFNEFIDGHAGYGYGAYESNKDYGYCYNVGEEYLELIKEETMKLSKENSKIVKAVEKEITTLIEAKLKHVEKMAKIDKIIADLKVKKDKHMVEETKKQMTVKQICDALGFDVEIVKERN